MSKGQTDNYFGEEKKDTNIFYSANLKYFILPFKYGSLYVGGGYQQGEVQSYFRPSLLTGPRADSKTSYGGVTSAIGFQAKASENSALDWIFDLSVTYAPGTSITSNFVLDEKPNLGNFMGKSHLETKVAYGFQPLLLVGARF